MLNTLFLSLHHANSTSWKGSLALHYQTTILESSDILSQVLYINLSMNNSH